MANENPYGAIKEQIKALKDLTAEQIRNAKEKCSDEIKAVADGLKSIENDIKAVESDVDKNYVSKEYLAQSLNLQNEKYLGEINKIYAKFDPIRSVLYFIATTIGGVFLVALAGFVLKGIAQGVSP